MMLVFGELVRRLDVFELKLGDVLGRWREKVL